MQPPTLPPWLSPWSSGLLYGQRVYKGSLRERYRARDRHRPGPGPGPRLTIYTYNHDASHTHSILRIGGWGGSGSGSGGGGHQDGVSEAGGASGTAPPLMGWDRYAIDRDPPWRLAVPPPPSAGVYRELGMKMAEAAASPGSGAGAGAADEAGGWSTARGWVVGTALLALLVLLARAAENCIDKRFFKGRRRSVEWPTPNVMATSHRQRVSDDGSPDEDGGPLSTLSVDLPPPYSACATLPPSISSSSPKLPDYPEEPPPPYSDCYVEFTNKNGTPSVLILSTRRNSILNRHESLGNRSDDEPSTSSGLTDDNDAVMLEDIVIDRHPVNETIQRTNEGDLTDQRADAFNNDVVEKLTERPNEHDKRQTNERTNDGVSDGNAGQHREPPSATNTATNIDIPAVIVDETSVRDNAQVV